MKRSVCLLSIILPLLACNNEKKNPDVTEIITNESPVVQVDSLRIICDNLKSTVMADNDVVRFFVNFERENKRWHASEEGKQNLIKEFKHKMLTDTLFAKEVASYYQNRRTSEEGVALIDVDVVDDVIGNYDSKDGSYGQIKCFSFNIAIPLIEPLYNGDYEIPATYQIICPVPATSDSKYMPYTKNVNFVTESDKYEGIRKGKGLDLGSYILGEKKND